MTFAEIRRIAAEQGVKVVGVKKADIVRAIQRREGNSPCFGTGSAGQCGQTNCLWHSACD